MNEDEDLPKVFLESYRMDRESWEQFAKRKGWQESNRFDMDSEIFVSYLVAIIPIQEFNYFNDRKWTRRKIERIDLEWN